VRLHDQALNEDSQAAQEGGQPAEAFSSVPLEGAARNQALRLTLRSAQARCEGR
jgi:hypothetical protein